MNIYIHELKAYRKSFFIWNISILFVILLLMSIYPGFAKDAPETKKLLSGYPDIVLKLAGIDLNVFLSVLGFFSFILTYILLIGAIQALNIGVGMLSKETREKTADFLLTKPVTRTQIVSAKCGAAFTIIALTNLVFILGSYIIASSFRTSNDAALGGTFFLLAFSLFLVQIFFLSIGFILSVSISKIKSVISVSLPIVFGFFIIGMLGNVIGDKAVRYLTPYEYYNRPYILSHHHYELSYIIIEFIIVIILFTLTYRVYLKKDIHAI